MGAVYRVLDKRLDREAALKVVLDPSPEVVARFKRESRITAHLDHPTVPPVYEAGTTPEGQHYLLMRVVEGDALSRRVRDLHAGTPQPIRRSGPVADLLHVLVDVAEGVAYAHSQGVIHRDLKPSNVMVGRFGEVLVMDWGLALELGREAEDTALRQAVSAATEGAEGLTQAGSVLGTLGYMPPEQANGEASTPEVDVFALGAVLTEILTGRPPIEGATFVNKLNATVQGNITTPRARRSDVDRDLDAIAAQALAIDPAQRPTADGFLLALKAWLANDDVPAYTYGAGERVLRLARRRPGALLSLAALAGLLAVAGGALQLRAAAEVRRLEAEKLQAAATREEELAKAALGASERAQIRLRTLRRCMKSLAKARPEAMTLEELIEQIEGALSEFEKRDSVPHFVLYAAADRYTTGRHFAEAEKLLEEILARDPLALRALEQLYVLDQERAFHALQKARNSSVEGRWELINAAVAKSGLRLQTAVLEAGVDHEIKSKLEGDEAFKAGDLVGAEAAYRETLRRQPQFSLARMNLARVYWARSRHAAAEKELVKAVEIDRTNMTAMLLLASIYEELDMKEPYVKTITEVLRVSKQPVLLYNRGCVLSELGRIESAHADFDSAIKLQPGFAFAYMNRSATGARLGNLKVAAEDAETAMNLIPSDPDAHTQRARVASQMRDYSAVKTHTRVALALKGDHAGALTLLGDAHRLLKEYPPAIEAYGLALASDPSNHGAGFGRSLALQYSKRYAEAEASYTRHLSTYPKDDNSYTNRGMCRGKLGRWEEAQADYTECLKLKPRKLRSLAYRGRASMKLGKVREALTDLDLALRVSRRFKPARRSRAEARIFLGDLEGAEKDLSYTLSGNQGSAMDFRLRAYIRFARGDREGAGEDLERSLKKWEDQPKVKAALTQLRAGKSISLPSPAVDAPSDPRGQ